ncbi:unnamed protein product [Lota lota]
MPTDSRHEGIKSTPYSHDTPHPLLHPLPLLPHITTHTSRTVPTSTPASQPQPCLTAPPPPPGLLPPPPPPTSTPAPHSPTPTFIHLNFCPSQPHPHPPPLLPHTPTLTSSPALRLPHIPHTQLHSCTHLHVHTNLQPHLLLSALCEC